jgi:hypothetical protein
VGDETTEFASRFSGAVAFLREVAGQRSGASTVAVGADAAAEVRRALDAVEAVYATETGAVRDWPEQRRRVLAQVAAVRSALLPPRTAEDLRRETGSLVLLIDPGTPGARSGSGGSPGGGGRRGGR